MEDVICSSSSTAGALVIGVSSNGWIVWKDKDGNKLSVFRNKNKINI